MPAAAVIPAPMAYSEVVAVKKLVVGFLDRAAGPLRRCDKRCSRCVLIAVSSHTLCGERAWL